MCISRHADLDIDFGAGNQGFDQIFYVGFDLAEFFDKLETHIGDYLFISRSRIESERTQVMDSRTYNGPTSAQLPTHLLPNDPAQPTLTGRVDVLFNARNHFECPILPFLLHLLQSFLSLGKFFG